MKVIYPDGFVPLEVSAKLHSPLPFLADGERSSEVQEYGIFKGAACPSDASEQGFQAPARPATLPGAEALLSWLVLAFLR